MQKAVRLLFGTFVVLVALLMFAQSSSAQTVQFTVRLTVTDGLVTQQLYMGFKPSGNFCIVPQDSLAGHAEEFLPPAPPGGIFDARYVWPRSGSNLVCFDQGSWTDIRPYTANSQRDTFRVKMQIGDGTTKTISWPSGLSTLFTGLTLRYFDTNLGQNVNVDMLTNTTANFTDTDDPATINIYSAGLTGTGVDQTSTNVPAEFALGQNYPNPFNPSTTIRFDIAQSARTDIAIFDVLGRKVATLASENFAPGSYSVQWDGKNSAGASVATGIYFARMSSTADNGASFTAMRKLMLLK